MLSQISKVQNDAMLVFDWHVRMAVLCLIHFNSSC